MKKFLLLICFLALILHVQAQTLYGLTPLGGNDGWGALIKFLPATNNLSVAKSFESFAASPHYTNFIQASDGKLYGTTRFGGKSLDRNSSGGGAIFSFNPSTSVYTKLKDFDGINGQHILLRPNARNYSGGKNSSHQLNHHKPYQYEKLYPTV